MLMNAGQMLSIDIVVQLVPGLNIRINEDALCQYHCDKMPLSDLILKLKKIIYLWKAIILDLERGEF